jgi:glycosyltransferase involved in cell wall biosynthesis
MSTVEFRTIRLKQNMGHGNARRVSLKHSSNELVALMDADDISMPNRFELQLDHFLHNPSLSIVGGQITEFVNDPSNVVDQRVVPLDHVQIRKYLEKRCPMNQVTVMFKKSEVQRAGGYRDWYCDEDYYLWARMFLRGCRFENTPECLVNVRVGEDMSSRRGGLKYFNSEARMQTFLLQNKLINPFQWLYNVGLRFGGEVLLSNSLREQAFKLFRATPGNNSGQGQTLNSRSSENQNISRNKKMSYPPFSVAMCVYGKDNPEWFDIALNSIIDQTVKPNEIVLVVDGPVPKAIDDVIEKYKSICAEGGGTAQSD